MNPITPHSPRFDFRRLKTQVSIEQVLSSYHLLDGLQRRDHQLRGPCPLHRGNHPTAFRVDIRRGIWHCFSSCGGGDIVDLVRRIEHCSFARAAQILACLAQDPSHHDPRCTPLPHSTSVPSDQLFRPFRRAIPLDPACSFLQQIKGIHITTADRFEAGLPDPRSTFLRGSVAVRLHDPNGYPLGYCARRLDEQDIAHHGKWRFPLAFPKSNILYNAHRARQARPDGIVVVECPWSVMRLTQAGIPGAVALLGTSMNPYQASWLSQAPAVFLLLDGDTAGRNATWKITQALEASTRVTSFLLPKGQEPEDLTDSELHALVNACLISP